MKLTRRQVLRARVRAQQLDRAVGTVADTAVLDLGVQDTGTDGGSWALANRGVEVDPAATDELALAWTLRGAPHYYRRADLPDVAAAVQPWSEADAAKRVFDAAKPLKAAGIGIFDALDVVGAAMRAAVKKPTVKGEMSAALARTLPKPYLRYCRPCDAIHSHEQTFRLAALRAGLELRPGTSPPVLQRIPGFRLPASAPERFDPIRQYLRLFGPATHQQVAAYVDAPVRDVKARWPDDVEAVEVDGEQCWALGADLERLATDEPVDITRLLGSHDLFLQAKDRPLLVADPAHAKALWPVIGRPGAIMHGAELVGLWRPRVSGKKLTVRIESWGRPTRTLQHAIAEQAERLATHRGVRLAGVAYDN